MHACFVSSAINATRYTVADLHNHGDYTQRMQVISPQYPTTGMFPVEIIVKLGIPQLWIVHR